MAARIWPARSFEEAHAVLSELHERTQTKTAADLAALENMVARSWEVTTPVEQSGDADRARDAARPALAAREGEPEPPEPYVPLPKRTTHGGDWGPAMKAKLTAIALERRGW